MLALPNEYLVTPAFVMSVYDDQANDITLHVDLDEDPSIKRHASLGLLYGLAVMILDRQGAIAAAVDNLLQTGPISEVDAHNRIALLLQDDSHA